ncbi:MAG: ribosome silencing factor [Steroidobacteraceae bacterium]
MATAKKKSTKSKVATKKRVVKKTVVTAKPAYKKTALKKPLRKPAAKKMPAKKSVAKKTTVKKAVKKVAAKRAVSSKAKLVKSPLVKVVEAALADMKAVNITTLDVRGLTDIADIMIIASGNSDRHVKSIAERVGYDAKKAGFHAMGVEGERDGEWALVDLNDVIVHVMLPRVREFYRLESLWDISAARREASKG